MVRNTKVGTQRNGSGTIVETTATTKERYDGLGRLWKVIEFSDPVNEPFGVVTKYSYDVGNRLNKVTTTVDGVAQQIREFTYDNRSFLSSEKHPEKNGVVSYSGYDARGHPSRKVDGPNDLTYVYDKAERLLTVRETGGQERDLKTFVYASDNETNNWRKGKLYGSNTRGENLLLSARLNLLNKQQ